MLSVVGEVVVSYFKKGPFQSEPAKPRIQGRKRHKHKLFGPDFPRIFLTRTPGCPGVKKLLPPPGPQETHTPCCGRPRFFRAACLQNETVPKSFNFKTKNGLKNGPKLPRKILSLVLLCRISHRHYSKIFHREFPHKIKYFFTTRICRHGHANDFRRGRAWPEGLSNNFVQKKFALFFLAPKNVTDLCHGRAHRTSITTLSHAMPLLQWDDSSFHLWLVWQSTDRIVCELEEVLVGHSVCGPFSVLETRQQLRPHQKHSKERNT